MLWERFWWVTNFYNNQRKRAGCKSLRTSVVEVSHEASPWFMYFINILSCSSIDFFKNNKPTRKKKIRGSFRISSCDFFLIFLTFFQIYSKHVAGIVLGILPRIALEISRGIPSYFFQEFLYKIFHRFL